MCTTSIHTFRRRGCCGWALLILSYIFPLIAAGLIAANLAPYHMIFLPIIKGKCMAGSVSWIYYLYCVIIMVMSELMVYTNFLLAIFTAPGFVPHDVWCKMPVYDGKQHSDNPNEVRQLDREGKLRYCGKCEQYKPDNAHHCSLCGRCSYRMDHHCPWINNCVARDNSKFFLLFLAYIPVGAFHIVFTTSWSLYFHLHDWGALPDNELLFLFLVLSIVLSGACGIAFSAFGAHFFCMAYRGQTSVSNFVARKLGRNKASKVKQAEKEEHMLDLFGLDRRWWVMLLPIKPVRDDSAKRTIQIIAAEEDVPCEMDMLV